MDVVSAGLSVVCLAVAALHVARLAVHARGFGDVPGGPTGEVSHGTMALGMAAMFSPSGDPLPAPVWTVAFALTGSWFAAVALRNRSFGGDAGHHVVGSAAMLFMLSSGHGQVVPGAAAEAGHAAHHGAADGGAGPASLVAIVLAGYFAWQALRCSDRLRAGAPDPADADVAVAPGAVVVTPRTGVLRSARTAAWAHVVMAVAMTVMLLAMV